MLRVSSPGLVPAIEKQGRGCPGGDKIVPLKFSIVARALWPNKTAAQLATLGRADERTAKRWLRGEHEPPAAVLVACLAEMLKPE